MAPSFIFLSEEEAPQREPTPRLLILWFPCDDDAPELTGANESYRELTRANGSKRELTGANES